MNHAIRAVVGAKPWRRRIPAAVWRRIPVVGSFPVALPGDRSFTYTSHGEPLGKYLYWRGIAGFEPGTAGIFMQLATESRTLLDVGAYSGYYTLLGLTSNPRLRAHGFEPVPALRTWFEGHLRSNSLSDRCRVVAAAVSDETKANSEFFVMPGEYKPSSSLVATYGNERRDRVELPTVTLDDYTKEQRVGDVDLVKIDAEGAEDRILLGAQRLLREQRPKIVCEILAASSEHFARIEGILATADYRFGRLEPDGLLQQRRIEPDPRRHARNYLLWPAEYRVEALR